VSQKKTAQRLRIWVGIDKDDPPTFEGQAEYLRRHDLLLASEERRADLNRRLFSRLGENTQVARN